MKISKRSRWIILVVVLLVTSIVFLTQTDSVKAIFNGTHAFKVYLRVETEIMQKTPAGQYYESLFWKHNDELLQIMRAHPEHREVFIDALHIFVPELEALLNGEGDKVFITSEHVEKFKSELDWHASFGSPSLQEDIERERQRIPLDNLVGMTMNEALDFVNSSISPGLVIEKNIVPDAEGKWAYYIHNGVYFEYAVNFSVQLSESERDIIYLLPSPGSPEAWNPCVMRIRIWNFPSNEQDANNQRFRYSLEYIKWEKSIHNSGFPGETFIASLPEWPIMNLQAFQYNDEEQIGVETMVLANENLQLKDSGEYSEMVDLRYEYFQHLVNSLRVAK